MTRIQEMVVGDLDSPPTEGRHPWLFAKAMRLYEVGFDDGAVSDLMKRAAAAVEASDPGRTGDAYREADDAAKYARDSFVAKGGKPGVAKGGWARSRKPGKGYMPLNFAAKGRTRRQAPTIDLDSMRRIASGVDGFERGLRFLEVSPVKDCHLMTSLEALGIMFRPNEFVAVWHGIRDNGKFFFPKGAYIVDAFGQAVYSTRRPGNFKDCPPVLPGGQPGTVPDGVLYLNQPVCGDWVPKANGKDFSLRGKNNATSWRNFVLECDPPSLKEHQPLPDDSPEELEAKKEAKNEYEADVAACWLKCLAVSGAPIRAIYHSGGHSWHALCELRTPEQSPEAMLARLHSPKVLDFLVKRGADPAALTPIRPTRLPNAWRGRTKQVLIYLDDSPELDSRPIVEMPKINRVETMK